MKPTTITVVTVDGVMQGPGGPDEDRRDGFERGGWQASAFDPEAMTYLVNIDRRVDAFLFGRWTYDAFAGYWGAMQEPGSRPVADVLNRSTARQGGRGTRRPTPTWTTRTDVSPALMFSETL